MLFRVLLTSSGVNSLIFEFSLSLQTNAHQINEFFQLRKFPLDYKKNPSHFCSQSKRYNYKINHQISMTLRFSCSLFVCEYVNNKENGGKDVQMLSRSASVYARIVCRIASHTISVSIVVVGVHFSTFFETFSRLDFQTFSLGNFFLFFSLCLFSQCLVSIYLFRIK